MATLLVEREFRFEAAHQIHNHPGPCHNLHGHTYRLFVTVEGEADPETGIVIDFDVLASMVNNKVLSRLDHGYINDLIPLPSCENIAVWIWNQLHEGISGLKEVRLYETADSCAIYRGG